MVQKAVRKRVRRPIEWPWPPPTIGTIELAARAKLREYRLGRGGRTPMPVSQQLEVLYFWLGQLTTLEKTIRQGGPI